MIVTVDMLSNYMSEVNFGVGQYLAAEYVLQGVQADLERYLNRPLEPRTITETVDILNDGVVNTTVSPVISVPEDSPYTIFQDRLYIGGYGYGGPSIISNLDTLMVGRGIVTVTYTAGLDARWDRDPNNLYSDVRLSVLRVASREMTNRHDDTLSVKGLSTTNEGEPTGPQNGVQGWTMDELRMHDRLRRRVIAR